MEAAPFGKRYSARNTASMHGNSNMSPSMPTVTLPRYEDTRAAKVGHNHGQGNVGNGPSGYEPNHAMHAHTPPWNTASTTA